MGRSPGFGFTARYPLRPSGTRFRFGCATWGSLTTTTHRNSPVHSAKGTPSPERERYRASTACRQQVSGSLSLPSRGAFHLSLTVLVHYRWQRVFSLRRWSSRIPARFLGPRGTWERNRSPSPVSYRALTVSGRTFQSSSDKERVSYSVPGSPPELFRPTTPTWQRR